MQREREYNVNEMSMNLRPYSATVLALGGTILMILGLYFVFVRPPLLPEDQRYMGASMAQIQATVPGLLIWIRRVFWVMGEAPCLPLAS